MKESGIRGHHLDYLLQIDRAHMQYEQNGHSLCEVRALAESDIHRWMHDILWEMSSLGEIDPENREYYLDIVGKDRTQIASIAKSFSAALLGIYRLSEDSVHIHDEKDGVCHSCVVGAHCAQETYEYEVQYMRDVMRIAKQLDIPYETTSQGTIIISGQALKKILRTMNESGITFTYGNEMII